MPLAPITPAEPAQLNLPPAIAEVIAEFDARAEPFSVMDVHQHLLNARQPLGLLSPEDQRAAWAEILAFALTLDGEKPWNTAFGPIASMTGENGETMYSPDARQADPGILSHWKQRAASVAAPVLAARYNDLVWDLANLIASERRDLAFARRAIDAYLVAAGQTGAEPLYAFADAERALILALQIQDGGRRDNARAAVLRLHQAAIAAGQLWWKAWDIFAAQPRAGLTEAERDGLVADIEAVLARASDPTPGRFDPHDTESVAEKLIPLYRRLGRADDVLRLHRAVASAFEHIAGQASSMQAALFYQTSLDAYRQAGLADEEARVLALMEESHRASHAEMRTIEVAQEIPATEMEAFLAGVIGATADETLQNIGVEFLLRRNHLEESLARLAAEAPLSAFIPMSIIDGDRVVAEVGSIDDDPMGRLVHHARQHIAFTIPWLARALQRARERHNLTGRQIAGWANRAGLFGDGRLVTDGVDAWLAGDHRKAAHILIPQIEAGVRTFIGRCGRPTTKPHPQMRRARMVITMGELLFHPETTTALGPIGPHLILHLRTLYTDPRGLNWRNDLAHGLINADSMDCEMSLWLIHTLLLLGGVMRFGQPDESGTEAAPA